jgi:hypothetical protein
MKMSKPLIEYVFKNGKGSVLFLTVEGEENWTDEMFDSVAEDELTTMVIEPNDWWVDDALS